MSSSYHFARVIPGGGMEKLGYYDSCEGDSGGSMWVHVREKKSLQEPNFDTGATFFSIFFPGRLHESRDSRDHQQRFQHVRPL